MRCEFRGLASSRVENSACKWISVPKVGLGTGGSKATPRRTRGENRPTARHTEPLPPEQSPTLRGPLAQHRAALPSAAGVGPRAGLPPQRPLSGPWRARDRRDDAGGQDSGASRAEGRLGALAGQCGGQRRVPWMN